MRRISAVIACGLLAVAAGPVFALGPLDIEAAVGVHSQYVWRGLISTDDPVLQPELTVGLLGMEIGVWSNVDLTDVNGRELAVTETDWWVGYAFSLPLVSFGAGFIYYDYPLDDVSDTFEFYLGAEVDVLLAPRIYVYNDLDAYKGTYVAVGGTWSHDLGERAALDVAADLGWGSDGYVGGYISGSVGAGLSDLTLAASLPWRIGPLVTVEPHVTWATLLGGAKDYVDELDEDWNTVFFGATVTVSF